MNGDGDDDDDDNKSASMVPWGVLIGRDRTNRPLLF